MQLALHENARLLLSFSTTDKERLFEALDKGLECIAYLKRHSKDIDSDAEAVASAKNSRRRMAGINNVMAEIYSSLGDPASAKEMNGRALSYARCVFMRNV